MNYRWKFTIDERVRWGDVDAARIIFYGAYIRFFEIAETELFRAVGLPYGVMFDELDIWLPRVHLECDFHHAARLDDLLEVSVYVGKLGRTSMRFEYQVFNKATSELLATGFSVHVTVDSGMKPTRLPEEVRRKVIIFPLSTAPAKKK